METNLVMPSGFLLLFVDFDLLMGVIGFSETLTSASVANAIGESLFGLMICSILPVQSTNSAAESLLPPRSAAVGSSGGTSFAFSSTMPGMLGVPPLLPAFPLMASTARRSETCMYFNLPYAVNPFESTASLFAPARSKRSTTGCRIGMIWIVHIAAAVCAATIKGVRFKGSLASIQDGSIRRMQLTIARSPFLQAMCRAFDRARDPPSLISFITSVRKKRVLFIEAL
mmetsp:Transcript_9436/g.23160  ORF Transcript_9436/g.23160 Transcript_9436/m.23160 type:complete len:228 (-) Transcript_9436:491-1174(-)